mgnify:CR=1 FL=1
MVTVKEQTFNILQVAELLAYHFKDDEKWVTLEKENSITLDDFFEYAIEKCNQVDLRRDLKINMLEKNYLELYKFLRNGSVKTEL